MGLKQTSADEYRTRIARSLAYIQDNLPGELSLEDVASVACFSKYHFHRIFTALVGESLADYIRRLRLERAAIFLETRPGMTVTEVALAAGFSSPSVLSRDFAERFGMPPTAWKEARLAGRAKPIHASSLPWEEGSPYAAVDRGGADPTLPGIRSLGVRQLGPFHFVSVLSTGGYGPSIDAAWGKLCRWAGPRRLLGPGSVAAGIAWDSPEITAAERCRYSVCLSAPPELQISGEILGLDLPARSCLVLSYKGPNLGAAYTYLYKTCLPSSGFEPEDSPAIEFYRSWAKPMKVFDLEIALPVKVLA
jgi:AraC family transcriptional regulator